MLTNLNISYSYSGILKNLIILKKNYPKIVELKTAGISHDGREIPLVIIGKGKSGTLYTAGVHAREIINPIVLVALAERIARNYYALGEPLLDEYSLYFMPLINPDGYEIATKGYGTVRNEILRHRLIRSQAPHTIYKGNARGIDINRNFACQSFVSSASSGTANSENETQALQQVCRDHTLLGLIDLHSRGNTIYYHREALSEDYNHRQLMLAKKLAAVTSYTLNDPDLENPDAKSGGNTVQYFSETFKRPAFTIETVEESAGFPLSKNYQPMVFETLKELPLLFLDLLISHD